MHQLMAHLKHRALLYQFTADKKQQLLKENIMNLQMRKAILAVTLIGLGTIGKPIYSITPKQYDLAVYTAENIIAGTGIVSGIGIGTLATYYCYQCTMAAKKLATLSYRAHTANPNELQSELDKVTNKDLLNKYFPEGITKDGLTALSALITVSCLYGQALTGLIAYKSFETALQGFQFMNGPSA